jgi:hypothetical protein
MGIGTAAGERELQLADVLGNIQVEWFPFANFHLKIAFSNQEISTNVHNKQNCPCDFKANSYFALTANR